MRKSEILLPDVQGPIPETADSKIQIVDSVALDLSHNYYSNQTATSFYDPLERQKYTEHGYIVKEYFITGKADIYEPVCMAEEALAVRDPYSDQAKRDFFNRHLIEADVPYTTRVVVYKPQEPAKFSGNVIVEAVHPDEDELCVWISDITSFFMGNGDAYVAVQYRGRGCFDRLKEIDGKRYAALNMPDSTQLCGSLAQIGALLKSNQATNPLHGYNVKFLFMTGISNTGVSTATFANYHHMSSKLADGRNIYDGYLPLAIGTYGRPLDVPTIRVNTQSDFATMGGIEARQPDSDEPGSQYRLYEIDGACHWEYYAPPYFNSLHLLPTDFYNGIFYAAAFKNMYDWVRGLAIPPKGVQIDTHLDGNTMLDEHGNALGGVRSPYLDVPIAKYGVAGTPGMMRVPMCGYKIPFDAAKKKSLYGNHQNYVEKVEKAAMRLVEQRYILPEGAKLIIDQAKNSEKF